MFYTAKVPWVFLKYFLRVGGHWANLLRAPKTSGRAHQGPLGPGRRRQQTAHPHDVVQAVCPDTAECEHVTHVRPWWGWWASLRGFLTLRLHQWRISAQPVCLSCSCPSGCQTSEGEDADVEVVFWCVYAWSAAQMDCQILSNATQHSKFILIKRHILEAFYCWQPEPRLYSNHGVHQPHLWGGWTVLQRRNADEHTFRQYLREIVLFSMWKNFFSFCLVEEHCCFLYVFYSVRTRKKSWASLSGGSADLLISIWSREQNRTIKNIWILLFYTKCWRRTSVHQLVRKQRLSNLMDIMTFMDQRKINQIMIQSRRIYEMIFLAVMVIFFVQPVYMKLLIPCRYRFHFTGSCQSTYLLCTNIYVCLYLTHRNSLLFLLCANEAADIKPNSFQDQKEGEEEEDQSDNLEKDQDTSCCNKSTWEEVKTFFKWFNCSVVKRGATEIP